MCCGQVCTCFRLRRWERGVYPVGSGPVSSPGRAEPSSTSKLSTHKTRTTERCTLHTSQSPHTTSHPLALHPYNSLYTLLLTSTLTTTTTHCYLPTHLPLLQFTLSPHIRSPHPSHSHPLTAQPSYSHPLTSHPSHSHPHNSHLSHLHLLTSPTHSPPPLPLTPAHLTPPDTLMVGVSRLS